MQPSFVQLGPHASWRSMWEERSSKLGPRFCAGDEVGVPVEAALRRAKALHDKIISPEAADTAAPRTVRKPPQVARRDVSKLAFAPCEICVLVCAGEQCLELEVGRQA